MPPGFCSTFRDWACRLSRNMLHAVLHGKLDESLPEPDRLEDALTSMVFGALVWTGSWNLLARWLQGGASGGDADPVAGRWECWFWPRMAFAEPDVVLRLDGALVVVEAKYRSDRHNVAVDVTADGRGDQLVRQYRSVTTSSGNRMPYAEPSNRPFGTASLCKYSSLTLGGNVGLAGNGRSPEGTCHPRRLCASSLGRTCFVCSVSRAGHGDGQPTCGTIWNVLTSTHLKALVVRASARTTCDRSGAGARISDDQDSARR